MEYFAYITILWAILGKYRVPFSMFVLYINLMWKIRGERDGRQEEIPA
jgi:hypothetical protein